MDSIGICDICKKNVASFSCRMCGKRACGNCMTIKGTCTCCFEGIKV